MGRLFKTLCKAYHAAMFPMIPPQVNGATVVAAIPFDSLADVSNDSAPS